MTERTVYTVVRVRDVTVRDGVQDLSHRLSTAQKIRTVRALEEAGVPIVEVAGFSHPRVMPQHADAEALVQGVTPATDGVRQHRICA